MKSSKRGIGKKALQIVKCCEGLYPVLLTHINNVMIMKSFKKKVELKEWQKKVRQISSERYRKLS